MIAPSAPDGSCRCDTIWAAFRAGAKTGLWPPATPTIEPSSPIYLSCLICVQHASHMWQALKPARAALRRQPALSLHPLRFLHITVRMFGFAMGACTDGCDIVDFAGQPASSQEIEAALRIAVSAAPPFDIELRGLNSWPTGPFVQVFDEGQVIELRRRIATSLPALADRDYRSGFVPHLTLGNYRPGADLRAMIDALRPFRETSFGRFRVNHVRLVWGEGGQRKRLLSLAAFPLRGGGRGP